MELSKKIVQARKRLGLTQDELADLANVTVRTIQRVESGESIPRAFTIKALAKALNIDFEVLAEYTPDNDASTDPVLSRTYPDAHHDKHFLQILCLSCFSYLVIPFVHFLIPVYLLKKAGRCHPETLTKGRTIIRYQVYWLVALHFLMLVTLAYNFIMTTYLNRNHMVSYLVPFFAMYLLNAVVIIAIFKSINKLRFATCHGS